MKDNRKVSDVMTTNPATVSRDEPISRAARLMRDHDTGIVPVVDDGNRLIGVVTDRDIVTRIVAGERNAADARVSDAMSADVKTLTEDASVDDVHELMRDNQVRRVPIVNSNRELIGIVAQADLATRTGSDRRTGQTVEEISRPEAR